MDLLGGRRKRKKKCPAEIMSSSLPLNSTKKKDVYDDLGLGFILPKDRTSLELFLTCNLDKNITTVLTKILPPQAREALLSQFKKHPVHTIREISSVYKNQFTLQKTLSELQKPIYRIKFEVLLQCIKKLTKSTPSINVKQKEKNLVENFIEQVTEKDTRESDGNEDNEKEESNSNGCDKKDKDKNKDNNNNSEFNSDDSDGDENESISRSEDKSNTTMQELTDSQKLMVSLLPHESRIPAPTSFKQIHKPACKEVLRKQTTKHQMTQSTSAPTSVPTSAPTSAPKSSLKSVSLVSKKRPAHDSVSSNQSRPSKQRKIDQQKKFDYHNKFEAIKQRSLSRAARSSSSSLSPSPSPFYSSSFFATNTTGIFNPHAMEYCDWYIKGYGWYVAKIVSVSITGCSDDCIHLKNFDIAPSDRWVRKFSMKEFTRQQNILWAPLGSQTCEEQYVHRSDLNTRNQLQALFRCLNSQRWNLNRRSGLYLYKTYFGRPVTELFDAEIATEYLQAVKTPMDLLTMKMHLSDGQYDNSVHLFFDHLSLIWKNSMAYTKYLKSINKHGKNGDYFFPLNAGLALKYFVSNIALKHFNIDLYKKYPVSDEDLLFANEGNM